MNFNFFNMKSKLNIFLLPIIILSIFSCGKSDPLDNLDGTYKLSSVFVDGKGSTGSGEVTFLGITKTGSLALKYVIDKVEFSLDGTFAFIADEKIITLNPNTPDQVVWNRNVDESKEQEIEFNQTLDGKTRNVVLEFRK